MERICNVIKKNSAKVNLFVDNLIKTLRNKNTPRWIVLLIDLYIVANTFVLAYIVRFNFTFNFNTSHLVKQIPVVLFFALLCFLVVGSYKGIIRHTGLRDSFNIIIACTLMSVLLVGLVVFNRIFDILPSFTIPISILTIHFMLNVITLIASRYLFKEMYQYIVHDIKIEKVLLIYGAGETGLLTYSVLRDTKDNKVQIVGFIDDNKRKIGKKINGLPVYGAEVLNKEFIAKKEINEVIISIQKVQPSRLMEVVDNLTKLDVNVRIVPPAKTWIEGDLKPQQIKNVRIEDLLGRKPIDINNPAVNQEFNNKTILITGAAGSIGSEIARQVSEYNYKELILLDQSESALYNLEQELKQQHKENFKAIVADVRVKDRIAHLFNKFNPEIVFHAAAYKHVPLMECNPYEAVNVNIMGTKIVADVSIANKVEKFVMISTDKAVNPTNVMGASKRIAEMYISSIKETSATKFITTRFGNVLGSNGSVIPLFRKQIENGGPLTVTHKDITRYFMTIPEACQLVLQAGAMGKGGEIFVFDMGESVKIFDLALNMISLSGLKYPEDIDIKITGLRPGEKIYEELLATGENTLPTYHKKIMIAKVQFQDNNVKSRIENLCEINKEMNYEHTVLKMKEIVPEYVSNNSDFQVLDKIIVND